MDIDSARELKAQLIRKHLQPLLASKAKMSALGIPARAVAELDDVPRTMALGIARKNKSDFRLAVRIQSRALEQCPQFDAILISAIGEVEVKFYGWYVKRAI